MKHIATSMDITRYTRVLCLLFGLSCLLAAYNAAGQATPEETINTVTESFTDSSFSNPDDWEVGRLAYYSTSTPTLTAATGVDRDGLGWLRLTNDAQHQSGYIRYKGDPIKSEGLTIYAAFDFVHWDSTRSDDAPNGSHATVGGDGSSFFIYDADYRYDFHPGAKGGSLGYAQLDILKDGTNNAPDDLVGVAAASDEVHLYWMDNSLVEEGFIIERRVGSSGSFSEVGRVENNTSHFVDEDSGLLASTLYQYRVRAYDTEGIVSTSYSSTVSVATLAVGASGGDSAAGGGGVPIIVRAMANANDVNTYATLTLSVKGAPVSSWRVLTGWNEYTCDVTSDFKLGDVTLTFTPSPVNSWYNYIQVDYIRIDGRDYQAEQADSTAYDSINSWNRRYNFTVGGQNLKNPRSQYMVHNRHGGTIDYNTHTNRNTSFSVTPSPTAPNGLTAIAGASAGSAVISWSDNSNNETGFRIEYAIESEDSGWVTLATVGANATNYVATGLIKDIPYFFRARSLNGTAYSAASNVATLTLTEGAGGTLVKMRALGTNDGASVTIRVYDKGDTERSKIIDTMSFSLGTTLKTYYFPYDGSLDVSQLCVYFSNNTGDALIDSLTLNGATYEAENCTYNTGGPVTVGNYCSYSEWLIKSGYIDFGSYSTGRPIDAMGGVSGGYLGIGMDDWGNYSWEGDFGGVANEGRVGRSDNDEYSSYPGYSRHAIAARGDEASEYRYIVGTGDKNVADLERSMNFPKAVVRPTLKPDLRRLSLIITPENQLTVFIRYGTGDTEAIFTADLSSQVRPDNILFGFASSSGGATNFHEIRNVVVTTFNSLTWDGEQADSDESWSNGINWLIDDTPENSGFEDVLFENVVRRSSTSGFDYVNDEGIDVDEVFIDSPVSIHTITISQESGNEPVAYKFYGSPITLNDTTEGASISSTGGSHLFETEIIAQEEFNFNVTDGSALTFNGNVNNMGYLLRLTGTGNITLDNVIKGEGGLRIEDDGIVYLLGSSDNKYSGVNSMQEGTLFLNKDGDLKDADEKYIFRSAMGNGPIIMSSIDEATPSNVENRKTSKIYLLNDNQIDNDTDVHLEGGEIHLNGYIESGDDPH
ncbi:MAG: hypothetical protein JW942_01405 [Opitutales bacterium]|nr:hypothetical protein [Opitutales bacterium]